MKFVSLLAILVLVVVCSIEARSYARRRPVVKPVIKSQVCPDIACTLIYIEPQCRRETYYIHKGVQCRGCPEDICRQWQGGAGQWQGGLNGGFNRWGNLRNNWQAQQNWQNSQFW